MAKDKAKKWRRVELPEADSDEVSRAFDDAVEMHAALRADTLDGSKRRLLVIVALQSLRSRVLRILRAVRAGRVYKKCR